VSTCPRSKNAPVGFLGNLTHSSWSRSHEKKSRSSLARSMRAQLPHSLLQSCSTIPLSVICISSFAIASTIAQKHHYLITLTRQGRSRTDSNLASKSPRMFAMSHVTKWVNPFREAISRNRIRRTPDSWKPETNGGKSHECTQSCGTVTWRKTRSNL
jgi:hypothetical protein